MNKINIQTFWVFVITVVGAIIGYFNIIWVFPSYLSPETIGYYRTLIALSTFIYPVAHLGITSSLMRFHPHVSLEKNGTSTFMNYLLVISSAVFLGFSLIFYFLIPWIKLLFQNKAKIVNDSWLQVLMISFFMLIIEATTAYFRVKKKAWIANFLNSIVLRIGILILVVLYVHAMDRQNFFAWGLVVLYIGLTVINFFFLKQKTDYTFSLQKNTVIFGMAGLFFKYGIFALTIIMIQKMSLSIDSLMISAQIGLKQNAVYTTAFFMATIIEFPKRAIASVIVPRYVRFLENKKFSFLNKIYKKISLEQTIPGLWFLGLLLLSINDIYTLMPNGYIYKEGAMVVFVIGTSKIIDLSFGHNTEILMLSKKHIWLLYFNIILFAWLIIGNYLIIPIYGIEGVAWVTFGGILMYNFLKFIFLKIHFGLTAFTHRSFVLLMAYLLAFYLTKTIYTSNAWLNLLLKSCTFTFLFIFLLAKANISDFVNFKMINKLKKILLKPF